MRHEDELASLRRDLDSLLQSAAQLRERIAAVEREIRVQSIAREQAEPVPVQPARPVTPAATEPPPLPLQPLRATPEPVLSAPDGSPVPDASPTFADTHAQPVFAKAAVPLEKKPAASLEQRIGMYWFSRIAAVLLVLAVGWIMLLAAQYSTPYTRVAGGYFVCAVFLGLGRWLEKNYLQYARVLYAVGIATSYFVTFAAHYVPPARIIHSEASAIVALFVVVGFWFVVAQIRSSHIVATLVTVLGHITLGLAFFTQGDLALYSVAGIAVLGAGSAVFLLWNRWYYVAALGLVGCYTNHTLWWFQMENSFRQPSFNTAFGFLCLYLLTFALAELFSSEDLRRAAVPTKFRSLFVTANSGAFFALAMLTLAEYEHTRGCQDVFEFAYALVLGLIAIGYLRLRAGDPLYNVYMTKGVSVFTLGLAMRYGQGTLTASLAVESVVLLYSARRSGLVVTRLLAFAVAVLCLGQGIFSVVQHPNVSYDHANYWRHVVESAFAVIAMFAASQLYQRTDWRVRSPQSLPFSPQTLKTLWDLDIIAEPPRMFANAQKPYGGLQFPYVYAVAGATLAVAFTLQLVANSHQLGAFAALLLLLTACASALNARPFSLAALLMIAPMLYATLDLFSATNTTPLWLLYVAIAMAGIASMLGDTRIVGRQEGLAFHQMAASPFLLYCSVALMLGAGFVERSGSDLRGALFLAVAAVAATALTTLLHPQALASSALILLVFGTLEWSGESGEPSTLAWHLVAVSLVAASVFTDRFLARGARALRLDIWGAVAIVAGWLLAMQYVNALGKRPNFFDTPEAATGFGYFRDDWQVFAWALVSYAYALYAALTRSGVGTGVAALGAAFASLTLVGRSFDQPGMPLWPLVFGFAALAVFWAICERLISRVDSPRFRHLVEPFTGICVAVASGLLVIMVLRIPTDQDYFVVVGWGVLAFALFGVSLAVGQKFYRYAGIVIFFLATGRLGFEFWSLTGFARPLAFMALGVLMLAISFGYYRAARLIDANGKRDTEER